MATSKSGNDVVVVTIQRSCAKQLLVALTLALGGSPYQYSGKKGKGKKKGGGKTAPKPSPKPSPKPAAKSSGKTLTAKSATLSKSGSSFSSAKTKKKKK